MARYALEPIPDPSADEALRSALGNLHGGPRLGVIGSLGARHDAKAVDAFGRTCSTTPMRRLCRRWHAQLGSIGNPAAANALTAALPEASAGNLSAVCEGLLRSAEALPGEGHGQQSRAIYDRLRSVAAAPVQVRAAALRGAILVRGKDGVALLTEALRGPDQALAAAAIRAAMESPSAEVTNALLAELPRATAQRQGLLIEALADRHEPRVLQAVLQAAQSGDSQLRMTALRALKRVGDASCAPLLFDAASRREQRSVASRDGNNCGAAG